MGVLRNRAKIIALTEGGTRRGNGQRCFATVGLVGPTHLGGTGKGKPQQKRCDHRVQHHGVAKAVGFVVGKAHQPQRDHTHHQPAAERTGHANG